MAARISEAGLVSRAGRVIPWDQVFAVRYTHRTLFSRDGGLVYTAAGTVKVDRATAEQIEQRIAPWEAERAAWAESLSPAQRAEWLGLMPGESVHLKANRGGVVVLAAVAIAMLLGMGLAIGVSGGSLIPMAVVALMVLVLWRVGGAMRWAVSDWVVDEQGITVRGKLTRWSELRDCHSWVSTMAPTAGSLAVLSTTGDAAITNQSAEMQTVHRALLRWQAERELAVPAARGAGRLFPSLYSRRAVYANDDGLWDIRAKRATLLPWHEVKGVRWLTYYAELALSGAQRLTLSRVLGGTRLAEAIDQRLSRGESVVDDQGQLRGEVIERWLGVSPGGAIQCRLSQWVGLGLPIVLLMLMMGFLATFSKGGGGMAAQLPQFILMLVFVVGSARAVQADAQGLSIKRRGRREYFAWAEIESITPGSYGYLINTTRGPIKLSSLAKNQGLVIGIINRILTARAGGAALPDRAPLPETALSRLTGAETVPQDRGLSVAIGGGDEGTGD